MAQANMELRQATVDLDSVLDQCERLGQPGNVERAATGPPLPLAATVAIVQAGLREAGQRAEAIVTATEVAEEHRRIWQDANRRQEAVDRLVDRWRERERVETDMRNEDDLDDVVTARGHRTTRAPLQRRDSAMTSPLPPLGPNDFTPDEATKARPPAWEHNDAFKPVLSQARRLDDRQTGPRPPVRAPADRNKPSRGRSAPYSGPNPSSVPPDAARPDRPRSQRADAGSARADAGDTRTARSETGYADRDKPATAGARETSAERGPADTAHSETRRSDTGPSEETGSEATLERAFGHGEADHTDAVEGEALDHTADGLIPPNTEAAAGDVDGENSAETVMSSAIDASATSSPAATEADEAMSEAHLLAEPSVERPTFEPEADTATDGAESPESAEAEPSETEPDQLGSALDDHSVRAGQPALVDLAASTGGATPAETTPGETTSADSIGTAPGRFIDPCGARNDPHPWRRPLRRAADRSIRRDGSVRAGVVGDRLGGAHPNERTECRQR